MKTTHTRLFNTMKITSKKYAFGRTLASLGTLSLLLGCYGAAAEDDKSGWYVGLGLGDKTSNVKGEDIAREVAGPEYTLSGITKERRATGYKLFGGYQFNKYWALEGGYVDGGKTGFSADYLPNGHLLDETRAHGFIVDVMAILPITDNFSAFGLAGINYAKMKSSLIASEGLPVDNRYTNETNANPTFGVGLNYDFTSNWSSRLQVERFRIRDAVGTKGYSNLASLNVVYKFGHAQQHVSYEPSEAAVPAQVMPIPAPAVPTKEYCSVLDIEFEIDKDAIQRAEKEKLAVLGTFLSKYPNTTAVIEGHSDNVGTSASNMQLSQRRADSVVDYLTKTYSIDRNRLSAVGYGETRPVDDNATDNGKRHNRRIKAEISCASDIVGLTPLPARMTVAMVIEYDHNKSDIKEKYRTELGKVATFLNNNPTLSASIEGHTADTTPEKAKVVSQARAQNVVNYLVDNFGVTRSRLTAEGFGESRRNAYNTSMEGRQENRRVNIVINYPTDNSTVSK